MNISEGAGEGQDICEVSGVSVRSFHAVNGWGFDKVHDIIV